MSHENRTLLRLLAGHIPTLLFSAAVGATITLGVRSMFVDVNGESHTAHAAPADTSHHAQPGHAGHAHDGMAAPDDDDKKKPEPKADPHEGQGDKEKPKAGDGKTGAKTEAGPATGPLLIDLGNTKCPVMKGKTDGKTFSEWKGLRVGHCCPGCGKRFKKNPEALLSAVHPKWRDALKAVEKAAKTKGAAREKAVDRLAKKWKVVRRPAKPKGVLIDLGNAKCPVMGGDVDGKSFTEWNGLRIGHCCPGCDAELLAAPEKVLDKAGIKWRAAVKAVKAVDDAKSDTQRKVALSKLRKKWKVVREPAKKQ